MQFRVLLVDTRQTQCLTQQDTKDIEQERELRARCILIALAEFKHGGDFE